MIGVVVWASGLLMSLWIEWPMVAVGLWYGLAYVMDNEHRCNLIEGILNAQRYRDEILRSIVVPFIHDHHLMLQHDNAQHHVAKICAEFLEAKTSQFLHGQHTHRTRHPLSMFGMPFRRIRQHVQVPANIQQLHTAIEEEWTNIPQARIKGDVLHCVRQMVVTPDTDWFSDPPYSKLHILEWPFIVARLRQTCAIIILSNQHLDMPHLWGGWIISAKEKCSLTQI